MADLSPTERLPPKRRTRPIQRWQRWPLGGLVGLYCAAGTAAHAADLDPGLASTSTPAAASESSSPSGPASLNEPISLSGSDVRLGDLRALVTGLDSGPAVPHALTFTPSIGVQEMFTDNVFQVANPKRADAVTFITPTLALSGETSRLSTNLYYAPSAQIYANTSQQNQVAQNFGGQALVTVVPDTLFIDLRGSGSQQSANNSTPQASGNQFTGNTPFLSNNNRIQDTTFSVSPYVTHRFGGDLTATAGYVASYVSQQEGSNVNNQQSFINNPFNENFGNDTTWTNEEYATFTTGENFGRFNDSLRLDASQTTGSGVLDNARRTTAINYVSYAIDRQFALLASGGYEDIKYSGLPPIHINDEVWSGGVRWTPNPNSTVTVSYGHKDGFNSASLSLAYSLTARTRVFASYHEGLTSSAQELQDDLANSTVDQYGNTLDAISGAPLMIGDSLLGQQQNLYRLKEFTATLITALPRDTISLSVQQETRTIVSSASEFGQSAFSDRGISAFLNWTHELTPIMSVSGNLGYATTTTETMPSTTERSVTAGVQTAYAFSPSLTGNAQYYVTSNSVNVSQDNYVENVFLVGLRKSF
jgi:uncharacterized protein (PEP-CTERM system associated)